MRARKASSSFVSRRQSITAGSVGAREHEILGHRHGRHRGEVLVDHAEAERVRRARIVDRLFAAVDQDVARVGAGSSP